MHRVFCVSARGKAGRGNNKQQKVVEAAAAAEVAVAAATVAVASLGLGCSAWAVGVAVDLYFRCLFIYLPELLENCKQGKLEK